MSDYGDDYSDYGDEWFYIEEEFIAADDLAEHAVASPPPTTYGDDDCQPDWDRFDYYNDIEYASDGFDDAKFKVCDVKGAQAGEKRKRNTQKEHSIKRQRPLHQGDGQGGTLQPGHSPVVWRSKTSRSQEPKLLDDNAQSYALLKDWKENLADTPRWARGSTHPSSPSARSSKNGEGKAAFVSEPISPASHLGSEEEPQEEGAVGIDQDTLMSVLRSRLAAAGGPLAGMDPQELLQFAMRMAAGDGDGDDIAGEMADAMLDQGEEDEDENADVDMEANLLSWVAEQRNAEQPPPTAVPESPVNAFKAKPLPTPLLEVNRNTRASITSTKTDITKTDTTKTKSSKKENTASTTRHTSSLKRKADEAVGAESSTQATKKRATRSFDAPTAASQAKTLPAKTTRSGRAKKP